MRERKQLEQAPPRRRASLEMPRSQEQLALALDAIAAMDAGAFPHRSQWFPITRCLPTWSGWYDVRVPGLGPFPGDGHVERLWYDAEEGSWQTHRQGGWVPAPGGSAEWRGLLQPWPGGYRWRVPGAPRFRAMLGAP